MNDAQYGWTFCDDEIPDNDDTYLVIYKVKGDCRILYGIQEFYDGEWNVTIEKLQPEGIIAWQELPRIPKEAREYEV